MCVCVGVGRNSALGFGIIMSVFSVSTGVWGHVTPEITTVYVCSPSMSSTWEVLLVKRSEATNLDDGSLILS